MWEDVHEAVDKVLIRDAIGEILSHLSDRQRTVLIARYEFGMTYKEIGDKFKICAARASQIENKALRILRGDKYKKEFHKLGISWIDNYLTAKEREDQKEREEGLRLHRDWIRKANEKRIEAQKLAEARKKLKIVDSDIPKPEMKLVYLPRPPYHPPFFVELLHNEQEPYLHVNSVYGSIDRKRDPETYDRWLNYLVSKKL